MDNYKNKQTNFNCKGCGKPLSSAQIHIMLNNPDATEWCRKGFHSLQCYRKYFNKDRASDDSIAITEKQITKQTDLKTPRSEISSRYKHIKKDEAPMSVKIIGLLLILFSIIGFFAILITIFKFNLQIKINSAIYIIFTFSIQLMIGIGILNGRDWARLLFLWITPIDIIIGLLNREGRGGLGLLFKFVLYVPFFIILTRSKIIDYFKGKNYVYTEEKI